MSNPFQNSAQQPHVPQQPYLGQQLVNPPRTGPDDANPFEAAFDFTFDTYATPGLVKIVYAASVLVTVLGYVGIVIATFAATLPDKTAFGVVIAQGTPVPGLAVLLLGWIPALLLILGVRLALEQVLATVRTAMHLRHSKAGQ